MTIVRGGSCGPDGVGGSYQNEAETDRSITWFGNGAQQGVLKGGTISGVSGQMAVDVTALAVLVSERDSSQNVQDRGYLVWADTTTRVTFSPASVSPRNDALVAAFVDTEDGPVGTGALAVGPHLVVVPGMSGTSTPRTDAQIATYLGRGGFVRLANVPIAATDTQINTGGMSLQPVWLQPNFFDLVRTSSTLDTTTSAVDVPGLTITVPVTSSSEVYEVKTVLDVTTLTTGGDTFIGELYVAGTVQTGQALSKLAATVNLRDQPNQQWKVTGLTPGNVEFKIRARGNTVSGVYRVNSQHSTLSVKRVK